MPNEVDFTFNYRFSGIDIDKSVIDELNDAFCKFGNEDETKMNPDFMKKEFKKNGLDLEYPSIYSCINWICEAK